MFKINPKQIEETMKRMGIAQQPLDVKRVVFEMEDVDLVIDEPSVMKVKMQGQDNYQVSGEAREESKQAFSEQDIEMVADKTGADKEKVKEFLEENNGDIAKAILELKK
jgi:alpha-NAC-related protein